MKKIRKGPLVLCAVGAVLVIFGLLNLAFRPAVLEYALPSGHLLDPVNEGEEMDAPHSRLLTARDAVAEALSGAVSDLAVGGMKQGVSVSMGESGETATLYSVSDGWFEIYPGLLRDGRLFSVPEQKNGSLVAVLDEKLAFRLFGAENPLEGKVCISGLEFQVVGVTRYARGVGQLDEFAAYIPFLASAGMEQDTITLSAKPIPNSGASIMFASTAQSQFAPDGCFYDTDKEVLRAVMILRILFLFAGLFALMGLLKWMNNQTLAAMDRFRARLNEEYLKRMLPRLAGDILLGILAYGAWVGVVYLLLRFSIEPLYVFTEWVPENVVELGSWKNVFWNLMGEQNRPVTVTTRLMNEIRFYGLMIRTGTLAALAGALLYRLQFKKTI